VKIWKDTGLVLFENSNGFLAENLNEIPFNFVKNFTGIENKLKCAEKNRKFNSTQFLGRIIDENMKDFGFDNIKDFRQQVRL
jgi:hypothetical protein